MTKIIQQLPDSASTSFQIKLNVEEPSQVSMEIQIGEEDTTPQLFIFMEWNDKL